MNFYNFGSLGVGGGIIKIKVRRLWKYGLWIYGCTSAGCWSVAIFCDILTNCFDKGAGGCKKFI